MKFNPRRANHLTGARNEKWWWNSEPRVSSFWESIVIRAFNLQCEIFWFHYDPVTMRILLFLHLLNFFLFHYFSSTLRNNSFLLQHENVVVNSSLSLALIWLKNRNKYVLPSVQESKWFVHHGRLENRYFIPEQKKKLKLELFISATNCQNIFKNR
jgi:hypothetical protein